MTAPQSATRLSSALARYLGHWRPCLVLGFVAALMFGYLVPHGVAEVTANRTLAPRILDEYYLTWTADDARHLFAALGPNGRRAYQTFYLKLDFWFPVLSLAAFYTGLLSLAFPQGARWAWLNLLPLVMYLADMTENLNHFAMAANYPELMPAQLTIGPYLSLLKYMLITSLPMFALMGFAWRLSKRRR
jgi:hypothetical protein